jgi:phosphoglycerate dehydrogenase-like enzyme
MSASLGKVLITSKSVSGSAASLDFLKRAGCEVELKTAPLPWEEAWLIENTCDIDALVFAMEPMSSRLIESATRLKIIARPGVGYDNVDLAAATARGIPVTVATVNDQSVADFAFGLLLAAARGIITAADSVRAHRWDRVTGVEVWSKTLTIVGLGRIGKGVARRARGFDMRVLAVSEDRDEKFAAENGVAFVDLETGLREADFVSLHAPLTQATENMINTQSIAKMRKGGFIINTARGGLIDEAALAQAVREGYLRGAAVDVLREQGANSKSALIGVPGIIVTPHMATFAIEAMDRVAMSVAKNIVAVLRGERPDSVVNPEIYAAVPAR